MHALVAITLLVKLDDASTTQPNLTNSIVGLVLILGLAALVVWVYLRSKSNRPVNELRDRYARGEITQDEFEARMDDLRRGR